MIKLIKEESKILQKKNTERNCRFPKIVIWMTNFLKTYFQRNRVDSTEIDVDIAAKMLINQLTLES